MSQGAMVEVGAVQELPEQLQRELDLPRRIRLLDRPERGTVGNVRVHIRTEIRVVQDIEKLRPELQGHAFAERKSEVLVDAQVPLPEARPAQRVPSQVAERRARRR